MPLQPQILRARLEELSNPSSTGGFDGCGRAFNLVAMAPDAATLEEVLNTYIAAFEPTDDVALFVVDPREGVLADVRSILLRSERLLEHVPDVAVVRKEFDTDVYLRAADLVIGSPEAVGRARELGIPAFRHVKPEWLRMARVGFKDVTWSAPGIQDWEDLKERWLVSLPDAWTIPMAAFLRSVSPGQNVELLVKVRAGQAEETQAEITAWLDAHGYDPEQIPDIVLIEDEKATDLELLRAATAWIDTGSPRERALVEAIELPVIEIGEEPEGPRLTFPPEHWPLISVITPSFNQGAFIEQTIQSVLDQHYPRVEHLVVDGGSTDETAAVVARYPHVTWSSEPDKGQSDALNKGFARARGDIICWLNSDDWLTPGTFAGVAKLLASGYRRLAMGDCIWTRANGEPLARAVNPERSWYDLLKYWIPYSIPTQPSIFFRRDLLEEVRRPDGTYVDMSLRYAMDHDLWVRMRQRTPFHRIDRVLAYYRYHDESKSTMEADLFAKEWAIVYHRYGHAADQGIALAGGTTPGLDEAFQAIGQVPLSAMPSLFPLTQALQGHAHDWLIAPPGGDALIAAQSCARAIDWMKGEDSIGATVVTKGGREEGGRLVSGEDARALPISGLIVRNMALRDVADHANDSASPEGLIQSLLDLGWRIAEWRQPVMPSDRPLVSVVIPCYNYGRFLPEAVESVLAQTLQGLEIIIVNDGSTDDTLEVARRLIVEHPEHRIRLCDRPNSGRPAIARNTGIKEAQGQYILCLDADDKLSPGFLAACVRALESNPHVSIAYPDQQNFGDKSHFEPHPAYDFAMLTRFNYIPPASLFRRQAWEDVGGFDERVGYEDWDFWIACGKHGHFGLHVPAAIWWYRVHGTGVYAQDRAKDQLIKAQVVLNHPTLYTIAQTRWAQGVLSGDPRALGIDAGLGVVPAGLMEALEAAMPPLAGGKPQHVLFTMYGWEEEGGGTILPRQIAKALVRRGHKVSVIYTPAHTRPDLPAYHLEEREEDGVRLCAIYNRAAVFYDVEHPHREVQDPEMVRLVAALIDRLKPDIVHYHSLLNFSASIAKVIAEAGVPSVYTSHNYWPLCPRMYLFQDDLTLCSGPSADGSKCAVCIGRADQMAGYAIRAESGRTLLNRWVDRHLAVSKRVRDLFVGNGHDPARVHVLQQQPQTVEGLWKEVGAARPIQGTLDRRLKIGFIGSFLPQKGVHVLVKALQSFEPEQVEGHLFGGGPKAYEETLRALDHKGLVQFHGRYELHQLPDLLRTVDVVVVPSVWEDCAPLVVAEALAARCPVIGSRIGGIPDFIEEGRTGLLVDPRNVPDLASAIFQFLRNPALLGEMQANIGEPRGFDAYLDDLLDHYRQVASERALVAVVPAQPVFRRGLSPAPLEGRRGFAFFHHPTWQSTGWQEVIRTYYRTFTEQEDVCLVLWLDPEQGVEPTEASDLIERALLEDGHDLTRGPDLLLIPEPLDLSSLARLYAAVDCVVPNDDARQAERAKAMGLAVLESLSPDAWRLAARAQQPIG